MNKSLLNDQRNTSKESAEPGQTLEKFQSCKSRFNNQSNIEKIIKNLNYQNSHSNSISKAKVIQSVMLQQSVKNIDKSDLDSSEEQTAVTSSQNLPFSENADHMKPLNKRNELNSQLLLDSNINPLSLTSMQNNMSEADQKNLIESLIKDAGNFLSPTSLDSSLQDNTDLTMQSDNSLRGICLTTQRQREKFIDNQGYSFTFEKLSSDGDTKFWRCNQRNYGCKVRIHTNAITNQVTKVLHSHNHDVNVMAAEMASVKAAVKRRAKSSLDLPSQIINEEIAAIGSSAAASAINYSSLKRTIHRQRPSRNSLVYYDMLDSASTQSETSTDDTSTLNLPINSQEAIPSYGSFLMNDAQSSEIPEQLNAIPEKDIKIEAEEEPTNSSGQSLSFPMPEDADKDQQADSCNIVPNFSGRLIVETNRQRRKFVDDDGFMYTTGRQSSNGQVSFWRCDKRHCGCKARIHVDTTTHKVIKMINSHNHEVDALSVHVASIQAAIKKRARESMDDPTEIINEMLPSTDFAGFPALKRSNLKRLIQRKRKLVMPPPPNPTLLDDLFIPQRYHTYSSNGLEENFLLHDSGQASGSNRILIFGKEANLEWVNEPENSQVLYMDGTFRLPPGLYKDGQMFVLLLSYHGWMLPLLYALLPNKDPGIYHNFLSILKQIMPQLNPESIFIDYEFRVYDAVRQAFPSSSIHGSPYHYAKSMHRCLSSFPSALKRYRSELDYALKCKAVAAIVYVPSHRVQDALDTLKKYLLPDLSFLIKWLQDNYVGFQSDDEMKAPVFPCSVWNVNERVMQDQDEMTNLAEAAFRRLKVELGIEHGSFWKLIENLKKVQRSRDVEYQEMLSGLKPPTKRKKLQNLDLRIFKLLQKFELDEHEQSISLWKLLQGIALNIDIEP